MGITEGKLEKRGRYWHWRYRMDGEQRCRSLEVTQLAEARRIRQSLIAEHNESPSKFSRKPADPSPGEFWEAFEPWCRDNKRKATADGDRRAWRDLIAFTKPRRVGDITSRQIQRFKAHLKNPPPGDTPVSEATVNRTLRHLKAVFNQGIRLGLLRGPNPVTDVRPCKLTKVVPDFLTADQIERLLEAAERHSREMHWVVLLGVYLGLRKNEIVNCRWEWFDFDQRTVIVTKSDTFQIKDHEERTIPLSYKLRDALLFCKRGSGFLFEERSRGRAGSRYRFDPHRDFQVVRDEAGVPDATLQKLRRSFGSILARQGVSIFKISRWMGHSSVDIAARHYSGLQTFNEDIDKL